jgi:iron(III) transport system substrate-binding protein
MSDCHTTAVVADQEGESTAIDAGVAGLHSTVRRWRMVRSWCDHRKMARLRRGSAVIVLFVFAAIALASLLDPEVAVAARGAVGAPRTSNAIVAAARNEGKVVVWASAYEPVARPLLEDFRALYPEIDLEYRVMSTGEIFNRFLAESAAGSATADVLWSSAMDLQMKLANDGYAAAYDSPESGRLPEWAVWRDEAFGTTLEPTVFAYNRRLLSANEVPHSHAALVRQLRDRRERWHGRIATYDPEQSSLGFLLLTRGDLVDPSFAHTVSAYGQSGVRLRSTAREMLEGVASGEYLLAFDVVGTSALQAQAQHPDVGVIYPRDYALAFSRIALISRTAPHRNAARVFLDYLLSARGQEVLANRCSLHSVRADVPTEKTALSLSRTLGTTLKPIPVRPSLLVYLDQAKRARFIRRSREALTPQ